MSDQKPWEDFAQQPAASAAPKAAPKPWEEFGGTTQPEGKGVLGHARDFGLSVAQGVVGVPEAAVGLADIATGGQVGKFLENQDGAIGFRPKQTREFLGSLMTDASKQQQQEFQDADGVIDKTKVALSNPSLITNAVGQSLPLMGAGGVAGRAVSMIPRIGGAVAGAVGEGIAGAGSAAEQIRQETDDGLLTGKQAGLAAASGAGTALFGAVAGKAAQRLGIGDIDTLMATGGPSAVAATARTASKSLPRKALEGAISEGFLEELPQSLSEQVLQNLALDKPWTEGLSDQAVMGVLSGGLMGGLAGPIHGSTPAATATPTLAPTQNEQQRPVALLPPPVYDVGGDGVVRTTEDRNTALDRARRGEFTDVTAMPAEPTIAEQPPLQLPAPVYQAGADGVVRTTGDLNNATQAAAQTRADRLDRIRRGSPSEQMGLNPAAGPMSTAAALAVDNGASRHMAQQTALQQAADVAQQQDKGTKGNKIDPETGEITGAQGSLLANDPATELQGRLHFIQQTARANGWDMRLVAERDRVQAELAKLQPQQEQQAKSSAASKQAPITTQEGARQASAVPATNINATPSAPNLEAANAGQPQQQPQAARQPEAAAAQPQPAPAAATPAAIAPADPKQANLKEAIAKVRRDKAAQPPSAEANAQPAAASAEQGRYAELAQQFNAMVPQLKAAREASNTPEVERLTNAMRPLDTEMRRIQASVSRRALDAGAQTANAQREQELSTEAIGTRRRPSEHAPATGIYWEKTGANEWTGHGAWFQKDKTRTDADMAQSGGTLVVPPEQAAQPTASAQIEAAAHEAATSPKNDRPEPTDAQKEAGNYAKGHVRVQGMDITVENPRGSDRTGKRPDGTEWRHTMSDHYGYIKRTEGADGEQVDAYIGPNPDSRSVFVVDQLDQQSGGFDEHKVMLGFDQESDAVAAYRSNFDAGWKVGPVRAMSMDEFKSWLKNGDTRAPASDAATTAKKLENGTAPEHVQAGVDDRELGRIVAEFNDAQADMMQGGHPVSNVFQSPAKADVVRLNDKAKIYHKEHGWMTPAEAKAKIAEWKAHALAQGSNPAVRSSNSQKVVLSLFDLSGEWSKPWEEAGYQVYRFDIQDDPTVGDVNNFSTDFFGDWFGDFDGMDIHAILAACPCTDFAVSGARHFAAKDQDGRTVASVKLVHQTLRTIEHFKPAVWALENPVGRIQELGGLPQWRLSFDPNHLGDPYTKKTLIWGRFNGDLPVAPVEPTEGSKMHRMYGGKSQATKNARSVTPEGFSYGFFMANNAADHPAMAVANKYDRLDRGLIDQAIGAGVPPAQIDSAVEDFYYQDLDDDAANDAIRALIPRKPTGTEPAGVTPKVGKQLAKPPRGVLAKKAEADALARAEYFTPGSVVKSYNGFDRVVSYSPTDPDGGWSVTVRAVEKDGDFWVDKPNEHDRTHSTAPVARDLRAGPVGRVEMPTDGQAAKVAPGSASKTPSLDAHVDFMKRVRAGEATADEFHAAFQRVEASGDAIVAELATMKKDDLLKSGGFSFHQRFRDEKKGAIVEVLASRILDEYSLGRSYGPSSYVMSAAGLQAHRQARASALRDLVANTTADDIKAHAAEIADARREVQARREAQQQAVSNPQTLADFRQAVSFNMEAHGETRQQAFMRLTPDQRIRYDELEAESTKAQREQAKVQAKSRVASAGQTTAGEIIETKHTKHGHDLYVLQLAERVSREDYETLNGSAKRLGGSYSSYRGNGAIPGFQFRTREAAEAFRKLVAGDTADAQAVAEARRDAFEDDRSQSAAERLHTMAAALDERADEALNRDRKTNTARRARMASSADGAARADKALAGTMSNLAAAIESGKAKFLDAVRQKVQVEFLSRELRNAKDAQTRANYPSYGEQERHRGDPIDSETVDYASFPSYTAMRSDLASLARQMVDVDGLKKLGARLEKVADDVTEAYTDWAKANLLSVSRFTRGDQLADFKGREDAERAIRRSGLTGMAIVLPIKRGQNRIVMAPSEAMKQGLWTGDGDKRITLTGDFGSELVQALSRRSGSKITAPWALESAHEKRKRLESMGIFTGSEYRSALREFASIQEAIATPDKIKEMERAMIGRRADGLDFFPTSEAVVDTMLDAAEIEPGMSVLEPSAGMGHIADAIREKAGAEPDVVELSGERRELLEAKGYHLAGNDFMAMEPRKFFTFGDVFRAPDGTVGIMHGGPAWSGRASLHAINADGTEGRMLGWFDRDELTGIDQRGSWSGYDRIIMNPPFSKGRDIQHVRHAYELLRPGGRLVAIMGEGAFFQSNSQAESFRAWLDDRGATSEKLPEGSFMDPSLPVNTGVNARMVVIDKPAVDEVSPDTTARSEAGDPAVQFSFAGRRARGADLHALVSAQQRLAAGEDGEAVRRETGWHLGADGKWRFEISDHLASIAVPGSTARSVVDAARVNAINSGRSGPTISDVLVHPRLFAAYPRLARIPIAMMPANATADARIRHLATGPVVEVQPSMQRDMLASAILHELQHEIQHAEGFAKGGSVDRFTSDFDKTGAVTYRRLAGEVEARNTQARMRMTPRQRLEISPEESADIRASRVLVTFNGRDIVDGELPQNISGLPLMDTQKLVRAFDLQYPQLGKAVRVMLERGRRGMRGGVVMIDNNDPLQIAHAFATKAGTALTSAIQKFEDGGLINGFYDSKSGLTFLVGPNLDPITAPAVLLHEMTHGQQRKKLDQHAADMLSKRATVRDRSLREFLDRAAGRMAAAGEEGNSREAAAYIVEQAVIEGRSQGFSFADNRFLAWVDQTIGQRVGDLLRSFLVTIRQWMLRNGVGLRQVSVDDLVGYAMVGMERAARGDVRGEGLALSQDDARKARVLQGVPVAVLTGKEAPVGFAAVREWATNLFREQGGQAVNPDLGEVVLDGRAVRDSMAHGKASPYKFAAFAAVKDVLERGALVHQAQYHKGESFYVSAPVVIDGKDDIVTVLVRRDSNMQRMYLHSVATKEYLLKSQVSGADTARVEQPSGSSNSGDVASVLHRLLNARLGGESDTGPQFSRSGMRATAGRAVQELNKTFSAPGGLSWWHKTIGTMYNLAQRSPAFRPVFESAQGFIDDVSHYANDAADMAPKLLPKLDTWRDIAKAPVSAADNKAVAAPIFEGTLLWTRDTSGKPARVADLAESAARLSTEDKAAILLENGKIPEGMLRAWRGHSDVQFARLIDSRFESQLLKAGIVWTDAELRSQFKLSDAQVALYHEFRAATDRSLDTMARADMLRYAGDDAKELRDRVMDARDVRAAATILRDHLAEMADARPDRAKHLMELAHGVMDRAEKVTQLQAEGYAPLSRFGKYTVDVVDQAGERQYFGLFETRREANQMAEQMRGAFPEAAVNQGTLSEESYRLFAGITPETLELFGNALGYDSQGDSERDQAFQEYLRLTKTNRSAMRRLIHRKGIAGYSEDVGRVLASFIYSNGRQTAAGLHMGDLSEAVDAIPKEQGELKDAAVRLADYIKNPQEEAQAVRSLLFAQYLGGSVASALVNMTQPAAVTFPWLSQFGGARKAAAELGRAARQMATKGFQYEADLARALHDAEEDGTVSPQEVHQLMAQARGSGSLRAGDGTRLGDARALSSNSLSRLSVAWGKLFGAAEQVNRRMTFIAAYRMAKARDMADPAAFARRAVTETQFVYSKASKMQWGRGAVGGTLLTFKTYSIAYLELMSRLWSQGEAGSQERKDGRKAALLMLATLMLLGGAGGLPFAEDADDVIDAMAQIAGYNFSAKKAKQEFLESVFGRDIASFIDKGITGLPGMPLDVSGRLGMGNLIPGTGLLRESNDHTRDVLEIVGPAGDFASRIVSGARKVAGGDIGAGLLDAAPTAVRNLAKGADMAATGMYRDTKGYKVLDTNALEAALKAVGFQPSSVATIQEANGLNQQAKAFYNLRAQEIRALWAQGIFEKDQAKVQEARDAVADWNAKNPDQQMVVRMPDVLRRVREMAKPKDQRIADTAPKAMRQQMREDVARARADL